MRRREGGLLGWKLIFWLYLIALFLFVVIKFNGSVSVLLLRIREAREYRTLVPGSNLNLKPFATIKTQLRFWPAGWAVRNLAANVLAFVPFGYLLPRAHRHLRHAFLVLPIALIFVCSIEVFQYVTMLGACDVDDVILNMLGCILGYLLFVCLKGRR